MNQDRKQKFLQIHKISCLYRRIQLEDQLDDDEEDDDGGSAVVLST